MSALQEFEGVYHRDRYRNGDFIIGTVLARPDGKDDFAHPSR